MALPQPDDLTSLVLRTDFSDDNAWNAIVRALEDAQEYRNATFVDDPAYAEISVQALVDADAAASDEEKIIYLFMADSMSMTDEEHRLLAVDLYEEPGRTFRVPPSLFANVSANLSIANMDFAEYADGVDETDTHRGFDDD